MYTFPKTKAASSVPPPVISDDTSCELEKILPKSSIKLDKFDVPPEFLGIFDVVTVYSQGVAYGKVEREAKGRAKGKAEFMQLFREHFPGVKIPLIMSEALLPA